MSSASTSVNLLELAASALSSTVVAADQITALCQQPEEAKNIRLKNDGSVVTDADMAAQGIIYQSLKMVSSQVRLVGEESEEEVAQHCITGHEEKASQVFRLAQQEILLRYHNDTPTTPMPLAQTKAITTTTNKEEDTPADSSTSDTPSPSVSKPLEEYIVDTSRVCVFIDPLDGTKPMHVETMIQCLYSWP